jgi:hypothetical protein
MEQCENTMELQYKQAENLAAYTWRQISDTCIQNYGFLESSVTYCIR